MAVNTALLLALAQLAGCAEKRASHSVDQVGGGDAARPTSSVASATQRSHQVEKIEGCAVQCCRVVQFPAIDAWPRPVSLPTGKAGKCLEPLY